jgi:hypothetical protein
LISVDTSVYRQVLGIFNTTATGKSIAPTEHLKELVVGQSANFSTDFTGEHG